MKEKSAALLIITSDETLVETLSGKLQEWGVAVYRDEIGQAPAGPDKIIDVILVDVRHQAETALHRLNSILGDLPTTETILINSLANISSSMAGMRAGASDELIVPFDTETLRQKVNAACSHSRKRRKKKTRRSLFDVFGEAMSAATFAQAGEFETAIDMLNSSAPGNNPNNSAAHKKKKPTH